MTKVDIFEKVASLVASQAKIDIENVVPDTRFADLGLDSLDLVEMIMDAETEFDISIPDSPIETVNDFINLINWRLSNVSTSNEIEQNGQRSL